MKPCTIRAALLALLLTVVAPPELPFAADSVTPHLSIDSVAELATSGSPELVRLQRALDAALERLGWQAYRDDLAIALEGSVSGATPDELAAAGAASVNLAIEIIPQLTITGELVGRLDIDEAGPDEPYGASVGLTLEPLADAQRRPRDELAVEKATIELESTARSIAADAIDRLLTAVRTEERIPLLESALAIAEQRLERTEALAERARATADDVIRAAESLRTARQTLERARLDAQRARLRLAQRLRIPADEIVLAGSDELGLDDYVGRIRDSTAALDTAELVGATEAVEEARINLESARIDAAAARRFTPELSASAAMELPGRAYSLGLSLEMRPSDWDGTARAQAAMDLTVAERSYESTLLAKELDLRIARLGLAQALEDLEAARSSYEVVSAHLEEALFLFDRGDATALDVSQAELDLTEAEYRVSNARAAVVSAWFTIDLARF